ncbi:MAG: hypothetical protein ACRD43_05010, partial [Pyrinomonadaceae bacterium]
MKRLLGLAILMLILSIVGFGDIAQPKDDKAPAKHGRQIDVGMMIKLDHEAKEARLIIPRSDLKRLRAQIDQLDDDSNTAASIAPVTSKIQAIASGIFMSLALVFGGLWFVRSGKAATKTGKSLVVLALIAGIASAATFVYANAGPPPEARSITGKMFSQAIHLYGVG